MLSRSPGSARTGCCIVLSKGPGSTWTGCCTVLFKGLGSTGAGCCTVYCLGALVPPGLGGLDRQQVQVERVGEEKEEAPAGRGET